MAVSNEGPLFQESGASSDVLEESQDMPVAYKRTEVGVIPRDWKVHSVRQLGRVVTGGTPSTAIRQYWNGEYPWVTPSDISDKKDIHTTERRLTESGLDAIRELPADTVLVTCIASIGKNAILRERGGCNQQINAVVPTAEHFADFLYYVFEDANSYLLSNAGTTATPILSKRRFQELLFAVPVLAEQHAIAEALSDVDDLLSALEVLISKKRAIKHAAMRQLLTGKTRLPGFSGEWEEVSLGELFEFKNGLNKAKRFFGRGTPIVNYMDVFEKSALTSSDLTGRVELSRQEIQNYDVRRGDVFFTRTSETPAEIGIAAVMLDEPIDTVFSGFVLRARPTDDRIHDEFKAYCFGSRSVRRQIVSTASYTTRALTNGKLLSRVSVALPSQMEQAAIATALSDIDAEIAELEAQRDKTRAIKQGMMQQLLTGRVRLVKPHEVRS